MRGREPQAGRRGMVLILVLCSMMVLAGVLAATARTVSTGWRAAGRFRRESELREALDAGLVYARARLAASAEDAFELKGKTGRVAWEAACRPDDAQGRLVLVSALSEGGWGARCEALLVREGEPGGGAQWRIARYQETRTAGSGR